MPITINIDDAIKGIQNWQRKLKPALASALSDTARQGKTAVVEHLQGAFTLRNRYTAQGVKAKAATATNLVASVIFDRDYMVINETGGMRISQKGGGHFIAVPMAPELLGSSPIPATLRPKWLLRQADLGNLVNVRNIKLSKGKRALAFASFGIGFIFHVGTKAFIVTRVRPGPRGLKFWYYLAPSTFFRNPKLHMLDTVTRVAQQNLQKNLRYRLEGIR